MKLEVGDLVKIDLSLPQWSHLEGRSEKHALKSPGVIIEITEVKNIVRFGNFTAFLNDSDLIKLSEDDEK